MLGTLPRKPGWRRYAGANLNAAAHYQAAAIKREQEGVPCVGLCNDRRQLSQMAGAVHSDNIKSYMCLCCYQMRTRARNWECAYEHRDEEKKNSGDVLLRRARKFA